MSTRSLTSYSERHALERQDYRQGQEEALGTTTNGHGQRTACLRPRETRPQQLSQ